MCQVLSQTLLLPHSSHGVASPVGTGEVMTEGEGESCKQTARVVLQEETCCSGEGWGLGVSAEGFQAKVRGEDGAGTQGQG